MKLRDRDSNKAQSKRFIEAAKAAETDDDKERFEKRLGKIAKAKASPPTKAGTRQS